MPRPHFTSVLFAALLASAALAAQKDEPSGECKQYLQTPLPPEATQLPSAKTWPNCESYKSYSGIARAVDYTAARRCAWQERVAIQKNLGPHYSVASVVGGSAMLMVLYSNGEGVERNVPLAKRFACEAQMNHALKDIDDFKPGSKTLNFCDEAMDTFSIGFCSELQSEIQDQERNKSFAAISEHWSGPEKAAFGELVRADERYSTAHAAGEMNKAGSGRVTWALDEEWDFREQFLKAIQKSESGSFPDGDAATAAQADKELNEFYLKALKLAEAHKTEYGAVEPKGIRDAERAWLKYRDAWLNFVKLRYPSTTTDAWITLLTRDRISALANDFCAIADDSWQGACEGGERTNPAPLP